MNRREFWDRCLRVYDGLNHLDDYRGCLEDAVREMSVLAGDRVLDAGSGTGNLSILLKKQGARVVSMDFSPVALQVHRQKDPEAVTIQASLESPLPFDEVSFDHVACLSVLFAISPEGSRLALREFHRVLRPGGRVVLTAMMPGHSKVRGYISHLVRRVRAVGWWGVAGEFRRSLIPVTMMLYYNIRMYALRKQQGYRRFSKEELLAETRSAGFGDVRCLETYGGRFLMVVGHVLRQEAPQPDHNPTETAAIPASTLVGA